MTKRPTIRWNDNPIPLYRRMVAARMFEQVRQWRAEQSFREAEDWGAGGFFG